MDVAKVVALLIAVNQAVFGFAPITFGVLRDLAGGGWAPIAAATLVKFAGAFVVLCGPRATPAPP